jgi:hypothetical protein
MTEKPARPAAAQKPAKAAPGAAEKAARPLREKAAVTVKPAVPLPPPTTDPIFVLAAPRSFSSLVNAMIGQHPELYGVPELNLFQCETIEEFNTGLTPEGTKKSPFWKSMRHGLLRTVAQLYAGEQTLESIAMAERWLKAREVMTSVEVFQELCDKVAPLRIVEKSPGVLRLRSYMDRMLSACPTARFIHLVRHPIPQGQSVLKAKGGVGVLMALNAVDQRHIVAELEPQIAWHDAQVQILKFLDTLPDSQFITLRGEDLMNNMDEMLPALCRWLGISDAPEAIEAMKHPEASSYSCMGPANASLGNDVNFLKEPKLRPGKIKVPDLDSDLPWRKDKMVLHPRVKALAQALGY